MKKFLSLILLSVLGMSAAWAQITVTCDGKEVNDGDALTFYATEAEDEFGEVHVSAGPGDDPTFKSTTPGMLTVTVTTSPNANEGGLNWCGIIEQCNDITGGTETRSIMMEDKNGLIMPRFMRLHANFKQGDYKTYTATVSVKFGLTHIMTFYERFIYDAEHAAGIEGVTTSKAQVKFNGRALNYNFGAQADRAIRVYALDGKLVKNVAVSGTNGSVSLDGLQQGLYVYNVLEAGKQVQSQKIVLK